MESKRQKSSVHNLETDNRREFEEIINYMGALIVCVGITGRKKRLTLDRSFANTIAMLIILVSFCSLI